MTVSRELRKIKKGNGGFLDPQKVVNYARNPATALHSKFTWDDAKAAEEYRIWQARQIIRLELIVIEETNEPVRAYVSLQIDRTGGGYRAIRDVMRDPELRGQLLDEAKADMILFRRKYGMLISLAKIFEEMDKI